MVGQVRGKSKRSLSRPWGWAIPGLVCASLTLVLGSHSLGQGTPPPGPRPAEPPVAQAPLDQPLAWLLEARRNYTAVQDYTCTLLKRENVNGILSDEHFIHMKFRSQPFSVYMRWLGPSKFAGQEVAYIEGRNNNKMRVHANRLFKGGIAGFVSIDVNDPRVLEHSRHTILEAGIGNVIEHTIRAWEIERKINKTQVKTAEFKFDNRLCIRIESIRTERRPEFYSYRSVLYIDKDAKLPIRAENYDWPRQGGPADGDLLEVFSYVGLRFNSGLSEREFNK